MAATTQDDEQVNAGVLGAPFWNWRFLRGSMSEEALGGFLY
jgi:hypothetical protein